jgi:ABC-type uncharacterized transport system permease subunit
MDKLKFIGLVFLGVAIAYLFLSVLMPLFVTVTGDAVTETQASPNAASYSLSIFGIRYFNLFIYFIPAAVGVTAIVWKLRRN